MTRSWREGGLLLVVLLLQVASPRAGGHDVSAVAGAVATVAAVGQVVLLTGRRARPVLVAAGVVLAYGVQVAAVDVVAPVAPWVALWSLAAVARDRTRALRSTAGVTAAVVSVVAVAEVGRPGGGLGPAAAAVTVVVGLVALLRRSEQARLDAVRAEAATAERLRLAGDLHDLAGHGLSVVAVQSSTARMALDAGDEATARAALGALEASSRSALKEMRQLLGVLRDAPAATGPAPGLADIAGLVTGVRSGGLAVEAQVVVADVPPGVGLCAYRVVQEALTNAVRHSPGAVVHVRVADEPDVLRVSVVSRGRAAPATGGGTGLDGLRARVAALGGTTRIGPTADGWSVEADLPKEAT
jgi:signal transduction histidine kinase